MPCCNAYTPTACGVTTIASPNRPQSSAPSPLPLPPPPPPPPQPHLHHRHPPFLQVAGNPCLSYVQHIVLPWCEKFEVERAEANGGNK